MTRPIAPILALLVLLAAPAARAGEQETERLRVLSTPQHAEFDAAHAWWKALSKARQVSLLREALASDDEQLAEIGARALDASMLDLGEVRRMTQLLLRRPLSLVDMKLHESWGFADLIPAGTPELLPYWRATVANPPASVRVNRFGSMHRGMLPRHVRDLLPLLPRARADVFCKLMHDICICANHDRQDHHRSEIARALHYGLRRLEAERAGTEVPVGVSAEDISASPAVGGLPRAFHDIAQAYWLGETDVFKAPSEEPEALGFGAPMHWLVRWALSLTPGVSDTDVLHAIVDASRLEVNNRVWDPVVDWALRHLVRMSGPKGRAAVAAWAGAKGDVALSAAYVLAEAGAPEHLLAYRDARSIGHWTPWRFDRATARLNTAAVILGSVHVDLRAGSDLGPEVRAALKREDGYEIGRADLDAIEDLLWRGRASAPTLVGWYMQTRQGRISDERLDALLQRLGTMAPFEDKDGEYEDWRPFVAVAELRRPQAVRTMLRKWVERQPALRPFAIRLLATLGGAGDVDALIASWRDWDYPFLRHFGWELGLVKHPRVHAFLEQQASDDDFELAMGAVVALMLQAGLPPEVRHAIQDWDGRSDADVRLNALRRKVLAGEPLEGLLAYCEVRSPALHVLGLVRDPRARAFLEKARGERHRGRYWAATVGLAISGDAAALREIEGLIDDGRPWMLAALPSDAFAWLPPALSRKLVDLLDTNCCLAYEGHVLLRGMHPTIPFEDGFGGVGTARTRGWLESRQWRHSRLMEGLLPVAR